MGRTARSGEPLTVPADVAWVGFARIVTFDRDFRKFDGLWVTELGA